MAKLKLKEWDAKSLKRSDWDFSKLAGLPPLAVSHIYLWELDRELGSGKGPFLDEAANRAFLESLKKSGKRNGRLPSVEVKAKSLRKKGASFAASADCGLPGGPQSTMHVIEIDWRQTKKELVAAFANWLDDNPTPHQPFYSYYSRGLPRQRFTLLEKIAIWRFRQCGFFGKPRFLREVGHGSYARNLHRINSTLTYRELTKALNNRLKELQGFEKAGGKSWQKLLYS